MVLKPEPVFEAVEAVRKSAEEPRLLLSPQGARLDSAWPESSPGSRQLILICGRYEGVDERVGRHLVDGEMSIGDYVLTGGEPAAWVVMDAVSRFIPGVVGKGESVRRDSFFRRPSRFPALHAAPGFPGNEGPPGAFLGKSC